MPPKDKYTDPNLREEVKEEIHKGGKGGAPGQWSARKTKDGSANAKQEDGTQKRYLPKKAWENMTEEEKKETDEKKLAESKEGKQHVGNTKKAKAARANANREESGRVRKNKPAKADTESKEDKEVEEQDDAEADGAQGDAEEEVDDASNNPNEEPASTDEEPNDEDDAKDAKHGQKRGRGKAANGKSPTKKQKTNSGKEKQETTTGSKKQLKEAPAPAASKDRLPKKGQIVHWHSLPGYLEGEVVEIVYEEKTVEGKKVKGTKDDPRIVMRSSASGKVAVHKPEAVFFE
ncbi:hypothetical protein LTR04_003332 [Oleoguttula sp. CCFEE 6159]|nr:hypothetical protein LTR04_003332 [Oleoguttula sp. CCFEE 6159]